MGDAEVLGDLLTVQLMYAGLFVLPAATAAVWGIVRLARAFPRRGWFVLGPVALVVVIGARALAAQNRLMPYVPQFLAQWGLGPADIRGGRPELVGRTALVVITVVVAFASIVAAAFIARSVVSPTAEGATGARLVATILAGQALGVVPPSLHFQNPVPAAILNTTLDRYLLPLLPLALCLAVWGVAAMRVPPWPAWVVTAGFAVVAVSGTRDFLHFQDRIWQVAVAANEAGIENTRLDSGAQWNGEHLYQGWDDMPPSRHDQPWWNNLFSWTTDSSYVVATLPIPGYVEVWNVTYDSWLPPGEHTLLLLRAEGVPPPP